MLELGTLGRGRRPRHAELPRRGQARRGRGAGPARASASPWRSASTPTARRRAGAAGPTRCTPCSTPDWTPSGDQGFPHGLGGADDVVFMPLQARRSGTASATSSTTAWPGTAAAPATSSPARATRSPASRPSRPRSPGAASCSTSAGRSGRTASCPTGSPSPPTTSTPRSPRRASSAPSGAATSSLVRTGQLTRARRDGWGDYAGGAAPGLSFTTADWLHATEIAGIATDTWGFEVRPNEFDVRLPAAAPGRHPAHRAVHRRDVGPRRPRRRLRGRRRLRLPPGRRAAARDRRGRRSRQPHRRQVERTRRESHARCPDRPGRRRRRRRRRHRDPARRRRGRRSTSSRSSPSRRALGSGHHLAGQRLARAAPARRLGRRPGRGYPFDSLGLRAPDPAGTLVAEIARRPDRRPGPARRPSACRARARPHPARPGGRGRRQGPLRHDRRPLSTQDATASTSTFADGTTGRYDLVVGADGIRSLDPPAARHRRWRPRRPGWASGGRSAPGPTSVTRTDLYYGGPSYIAGYCPTGEDSLYAYVVEDAQDRCDADPRGAARDHAAELAAAYHGPWDDIRATLDDPSRVNYTWFETHVLAAPWNRGRVVADRRRRALLPAHPRAGRRPGPRGRRRARRAAARPRRPRPRRCGTRSTTAVSRGRKTVVEASNQLGHWLLDHEQGDVPGAHGARITAPRQPSPPDPTGEPHDRRLITHLRHVDLAVPDYGTQLDFYTNTWGLTAEHTEHRPDVPGRRGLPRAVRRPAAPGRREAHRPHRLRRRDRRRRRHPRRAARRRRGPAGHRARHPADPRRRLRVPLLRQRGPHRRGQRRRRRPRSTARSRRASPSRSGSRTS